MSVGTVTNVRAVAQHHIVEDATVIWEDGLIVSVTSGQPRRGAIDGRGAFCLPGLIDTHSDALEKEVNPRPGTQFPLPFALRSLEGRCLAAAITTVFHGVRFQDNEEREASLGQAVELCETLKARRHPAEVPLDHYVLHRLDARSPGGVGVLETCLGAGAAGLVSIEDHTPGQGQFRDISRNQSRATDRVGVPQDPRGSRVLLPKPPTLGAAGGHGCVNARTDDDKTLYVAAHGIGHVRSVRSTSLAGRERAGESHRNSRRFRPAELPHQRGVRSQRDG